MGLVQKLWGRLSRRPSERRKSPRVPLSVKVTKMTSGSFQFNQATDISAGGVFIKAAEPLPVGSVLRVKITLPSGQVEADGEVVRVTLNEAHPGMGVKFINLPPEIRQAIEEYVARKM